PAVPLARSSPSSSIMFALRIFACSLLLSLALALHPSDRVKVCGSVIGRIFEHPMCDYKTCSENWPYGKVLSMMSHKLCTGDVNLGFMASLCCLPDVAQMRAVIDDALASAPEPAARLFAPRVPNVPRLKAEQKFPLDDSFLGF
ncbi:hypothetical protein PENTCL1PPCAC_27885, partial [Pristionchus entomophagus]